MPCNHCHLLKSPAATAQLSGEPLPEVTFERMPRFKWEMEPAWLSGTRIGCQAQGQEGKVTRNRLGEMNIYKQDEN